MTLPPLCLTGAHVLIDGALRTEPVGIADGRIAPTAAGIPVDLSGFLILPGIVDLHGDEFERHLSPRRGVDFEMTGALASVDAALSAHGVTTAVMAQSYSWEGGIRGPDYADRLIAALDAYRPRAQCDLRLQLRFETHFLDGADRMVDTVARAGIGYVVYNNHLPEALEQWRTNPLQTAAWAAQAGRRPEEHMAIVEAAHARRDAVPAMLRRIAARLAQLGVITGSHDDPDPETRAWFRALGARVCEFPTSRAAAAAAADAAEPVIMGAPNVVRGGSHSGNIGAAELIRDGLCGVLVSDYYYPALAAAAFRLVEDGVLALPAAWALVSSGPAAVLGLTDRGRIAPGLRADLVVIDPDTRGVAATIAGGRIAHMAGPAAARFVAIARRAHAAA